jgi:hypothetical protein
VTFRRPFILGGFDAVQAAGTYVIDVEEEAIENISFPAFRRLSTQIQISSCGVTEHRFINPVDLDEALQRDSAENDSKSDEPTPAAQAAKRQIAQRVKPRLVKRF